MASKAKLEDLNLNKDELKRLEDAFKDEKFRELFCEYAQEISDPENRRRYEEEIAQMEEERGMDVTFIRPEPGYVLKTSVDGDKKAFINISKSDKIDKPSGERKQNEDGKSGLMWHIPHSFAPPREDHDKQKTRCMVYDFVVHPDTYRMAESNARFKKLVEDTAIDGIERQFQVKLDRKNVKQIKMQFKGTPSATVIRNRKTSGATAGPDDASEVLKDMPYPYDDKTTLEKMKEREQNLSRKQEQNKGQANKAQSKDEATTPKYTIIHRSEVDMQEYRNAPDAKPSTRPRELVIKIELPLLKSAAQANLEIFEKCLSLESSSPTAYKLDLSLPYPVDDSKGSAKFDKQKKTLVVTLPVLPGDLPTLPSFISDETAGNESETNEISAASSLKESVPVEKPLIEVLSNGMDPSLEDSETTQQEDSLKKENGLTDAGSFSNADSGIHLSAAVSYSLPDFSFTQDTETITILLKVKNVTENSITHVSPSSHEVDFLCTSRGEGGFPLHFRLFLRFTESCMIVPEHCTVDVADDNVVLILLKERGSRGLWDQFWAGLHSDHLDLEKHLFLTTSNLQQQMEELEESSTDMGQVPPMPPAAAATEEEEEEETPPPRLQVTTINEKKLTIKICPPGKGRSKGRGGREEEEDDEYDPPSSAEIEVVHVHPTSPGLQGILKQTISESSEEAGWQDGADTPPQSSNEEDLSPTPPAASSPGKRRSVSFSEHIDKATFKASASVNSMKTVLKSKRRRQRKFEEKKEKGHGGSRRRHNSTGSEGSLSDSHPSEEEVLGGGEENDPEEEQGVVGGADPTRRVLDFRTLSDQPFAGRAGGCGDSNPKGSENHEEGEYLGDTEEVEVFNREAEKGENLDDREEEVEVSHPEAVRGEHLGDREEAKGSEHNGTSGDREGSLADTHRAQGSSGVGSQGTGSSSSSSSKKGGTIADKIKSKLAEGATEEVCEDSDDEEEGKAVAQGVANGQGQPGHVVAGSTAGDTSGNEHRTECAFHFSNDLMFDLDVE